MTTALLLINDYGQWTAIGALSIAVFRLHRERTRSK